MMDRLTPEQRSLLMSRVRGRDTKPEMTVRKLLHALGFRFRLHRRDLPGTPDVVLPRWKAIILVNGCFFHGHQCPSFRLPSSNREFWQEKIRRNRERDALTAAALLSREWRVLTVWECALRGPPRIPPAALGTALLVFLKGEEKSADLTGVHPPLVVAPVGQASLNAD